MADLISRSALLKALHNIGGCGARPDTWEDGWDRAIETACAHVETAPAVDAVEVVRCKDCKHFRRNLENDTYCNCIGGLTEPEENDFCSYGERRSE